MEEPVVGKWRFGHIEIQANNYSSILFHNYARLHFYLTILTLMLRASCYPTNT